MQTSNKMKSYSHVFLLASWFVAAIMLLPTVQSHGERMNCTSNTRHFEPQMHKKKYRVAFQATRGEENALETYDNALSLYLQDTVGHRFDEEILFDIVPMTVKEIFEGVANEDIDFLFSSTGVYACIGVEYGLQLLATRISRVTVRGHSYNLDTDAGVIFTLADNEEINGIHDLKDKVIGAADVATITASQSQFYQMEEAGMSYVMDPKKVTFTGDMQEVVKGVLAGEFDVGFVRTDEIERFDADSDNSYDSELFKVLEQKTHVMDDGTLFPFLHSTEVYPEWPVAALMHVASDVAEEVQAALLAFQAHAMSGKALSQCKGACNPEDIFTRCDTTEELAKATWEASQGGDIAGFRNPSSYFDVNTMQEDIGLLSRNELDKWECTSDQGFHDIVKCPDGYYKLTAEEIDESCALSGIPCKDGHSCFCKPCVKAFDVVVHEDSPEYDAMVQTSGNIGVHTVGCEKMSICGTVEQTKTIKFHIHDNLKRDDAAVVVLVHFGDERSEPEILPDASFSYSYKFEWSAHHIGEAVMEVFVGDEGEQIPESPIRVNVVGRRCDIDFPGSGRKADAHGDCTCGSGTIEMFGKCIKSSVIAVTASIAGLLLLFIPVYFFLHYKSKQADRMWMVNVDELLFDDPPEVIGEGSFGVVLLAEYRGTKVAIKSALKGNGARGSMSHRGSKYTNRARSSSGGGQSMDTGRRPRSNSGSIGNVSYDSSDATPVSNDTEDLGNAEKGVVPRRQRSNSTDTMSIPSSNECVSSRDTDSFSLGFLCANSFKKNKWSWLLPWKKRGNHQTRFKESILGSTASVSQTTLASRMCPFLDPQARQREEFMAEMRILARLRHPCITTLMGAVITSRHNPMIVMEYMEYGSLHDLLRNETMFLSGEIILQITRDLAQGLRFLHSSKPTILHGDLKARNILIDARFRAKICDFGLSLKKSRSITGTPYWLAPEYLRGECSYSQACDIYSVGIILFEIYARKNPYEGEPFQETLRKVCNRRINKRPDIPNTAPAKVVDLMKRCWHKDPAFRPDARVVDGAFMDMNTQDVEQVTEEQLSMQRRERATGDMLYEIFPKHIADALKQGQKVEPESHELVTIVFSDIVHFTDISREISPLKVSEMLDRLYLAFDKIANKHDIFKVETIGDAYMGVTNLGNRQPDTHVLRVAAFAIDMVNEASKILIDVDHPEKGCINIRVGFHSGPVVSNVIGSLNPRYGLFGDTVNTASRMESNSKANRIMCSEKAFQLLKEQDQDVPVKKRGKISVKGKGDMTVYWVGGNRIEVHKSQFAIGDSKATHRVVFAGDDSNSPSEVAEEQAPSSPAKNSTHPAAIVGHDSISRCELGVEQTDMNHAAIPVDGLNSVSELAEQASPRDDACGVSWR